MLTVQYQGSLNKISDLEEETDYFFEHFIHKECVRNPIDTQKRRIKDGPEEEEEESDGNDDDDDETIAVVGKVRRFVSSASSVATESAEEDATARHHFTSP